MATEIMVTTGTDGNQYLYDAIQQTLQLLPGVTVKKAQEPYIASSDYAEKTLFIICSCHSNAVRDLLRDVTSWAYSEEDYASFPQNAFYIFVEFSESDPAFWAVARLFKELKLGDIVQVPELFASVASNTAVEHKPSLRRKGFRDTLEARCFASGASEIREVLLRDSAILHALLPDKDAPEASKSSAFRLLLGAYCAGDIQSEQLKTALGEPRAQFLTPEYDTKVKSLANIADVRHLSTLHKYMEGRTVLFVEDRDKDGWEEAIPRLLGAVFTEPEEWTSDPPPSEKLHLHRFKTPKEALEALSGTLCGVEIDLVLLDLYSSAQAGEHSIAHPATVPQSIWELVKKLKEPETDPTMRKTQPAIVAFTAETNPMTVHTLTSELGIHHFFFKQPSKEEIHKGAYYASFRNAIVGALAGSVQAALLIPGAGRNNLFESWLRQFDECDRPLILHLMRHFRFFSAKDIITLFNSYFEQNVELLPEKKYIFSYLGRPNKSGPVSLSLFGKTEYLSTLSKSKISSDFLSYDKLIKEFDDIIKHIPKGVLSGHLIQNPTPSPDHPLAVYFLDDVSGCGGQAKEYAEKFFERHLGLRPGTVLRKRFCEFIEEAQIEFHFVCALGVGIKNSKNLDNIHIGEDDEKIEVKRSIIYKVQSLEDLEQGYFDSVLNTIKKYIHITETRDLEFPCEFEPRGWQKNCGIFSTYANTPGNTLPIVWGSSNWEPLFPRILNPLATPPKDPIKKMDCSDDGVCHLRKLVLDGQPPNIDCRCESRKAFHTQNGRATPHECSSCQLVNSCYPRA